MPVFKKFGPSDQIDNVLVLEPLWNVSSGALGWHGSPDGSASIVLYGGARKTANGVFKDIKYSPTWPLNSFEQQIRKQPQTSSIDYVWVTKSEIASSQISNTLWGKEHWDVISRLYEDYKYIDYDYSTSSYDNYCLYFNRESQNIVGTDGLVYSWKLSSSFTLEIWAKPFQTQSSTNDFTLMSMNRQFWFGITGSTGKLVFSGSDGNIFTSSIGPQTNRWSHISLTISGSSGSFLINLLDAGTFSGSYQSVLPVSFSSSFTIGSKFFSPVQAKLGGNTSETTLGNAEPAGVLNKSFYGFVGETRVWNGNPRTITQISSSYNRRLTGNDLLSASLVYWMNDGPISGPSGFNWSDFLQTYGSGCIEQVTSGSDGIFDMHFGTFEQGRPVWHVNDNNNFFVPKTKISNEINGMLVFNVPSAFYGRQIVPNSVNLTCKSYSSGSYGLIRTLIDDGRGNLFLSGSACSSTLENKEDYRGVEWNKVGNVFYSEGLITIRDPSLFDFGRNQSATSHPNDTLQLSFRGTSRIPVKTLMCRIDRGELNASNNQTFYYEEEDGKRIKRHSSSSIRITTIGVYNSNRDLVGVARVAEPVRVRPRDRINIKLKMDF